MLIHRLSSIVLLGHMCGYGFAHSGPLSEGVPIETGQVWTAAEKRAVLSLGPWPSPTPADKTNSVTGKPMAIELGRRLFRDARLSPVGYISCVTCHQPDRSFTDNKARGHGLADLARNTPSLMNLQHQSWYGWGGASDSLWMASIRPLLDSREFDSNVEHVANVFVRDPDLGQCYEHVFKEAADPGSEKTLANVGKALAAYQETLSTGRTPFDDFRDSLVEQSPGPTPEFSMSAQRGLKLFVGRGGCVSCHAGPNFSDGKFHAFPATPFPGEFGGTDTGRLADARRLKASGFNLSGAFNDDAANRHVASAGKLELKDTMRGLFRTPSVRSVSNTGPYMHDGRIERLQDAIRHGYSSQFDRSDTDPRPLSSNDVEDLHTFLLTLSDQYGEGRPWSNAALATCPE